MSIIPKLVFIAIHVFLVSGEERVLSYEVVAQNESKCFIVVPFFVCQKKVLSFSPKCCFNRTIILLFLVSVVGQLSSYLVLSCKATLLDAFNKCCAWDLNFESESNISNYNLTIMASAH
jgi:hypothetical protein